MTMIRTAGFIISILYVVGCDGVIGSGLRHDRCGVCGGDDDSCRIIKGIYTHSHLDFGYNQITKIPKGACHINVTELARSRNYLVLKYVNGTGVINGENSRMRRPGKYAAAGTTFTYDKNNGDSCPGECLYATGPLTDDVDIQLLTYRRNPGISYMFTVSKDLIDGVIQSLVPSTNTRHSSQGQGRSRGREGRRHSDVSNSKLTYDQQPEFVSPEHEAVAQHSRGYQALSAGYNAQEARYRYNDGYSVKGHEGASVDANTIATDIYNHNGYGSVPLGGSGGVPLGGSSARTKDNQRVNSIPQGEGQIAQFPGYYGNNIPGEARRKPLLTVPDTIDEVNFHWTISGFTECSTSCGGGRQDTVVVCMKRKSNIIVTDDNCDPAKKNVQTIICNKSPCPPDWEPSPWSVCSTTCGTGKQTRKVECKQRYSANMSLAITASLCDSDSRPATVRSCQVKPCADWSSGNWSKCSVVCGIGQISRKVECRNTGNKVVPDAECPRIKPDASRSCDMGTCAKGWFITSWNRKCSSACGKGYITRSAYCLAEDGSPLPEAKCGRKPRTRKSCRKNRPCGGFWFEGPWTPCTATCGSAIQTRDVICIKKLDKRLFAVVGSENCKEHRKPNTKQDCPEQRACPAEWFTTKWSQCSQSCGTGMKTRDMKCLSPDSSPSSKCIVERKPSYRRSCNTQDCDLPQLDEDPSCKDTGAQCPLVVQAELCPYKYFKDQCCHSCTLYQLKQQKLKQLNTQQTPSPPPANNQTTAHGS